MFPYTQNTGNLISLIGQIGKNGVPSKFGRQDLPVWGYKSSNDRSIISVLKFIGFLDGAGAPTQLWIEARAQPEIATAKGVRQGYQTLFQTFPDAERKDQEAITNFFKAKTTVGDAAIKMMVATFRALAQFGDFTGAGAEVASSSAEQPNPPATSNPVDVRRSVSTASSGMAVNLNIELALPADETGKVYEAFFAAMKKHLMHGSE